MINPDKSYTLVLIEGIASANARWYFMIFEGSVLVSNETKSISGHLVFSLDQFNNSSRNEFFKEPISYNKTFNDSFNIEYLNFENFIKLMNYVKNLNWNGADNARYCLIPLLKENKNGKK